MASEKRLLAGAKRHDPLAERAIFDRYHARLERLCRVKLRLGEADAEEVALDALAVLLLDPSRFDPRRGVPLGAWLWRIAHNRGVDRVRAHERRREAWLNPSLAAPEDGAVDPGPMQHVADALALLADRLKPEQRRILELHALGFRHGEIARFMDRSEAAVRQIVCRGKRRIREAVEAGALGEETTAVLHRWLARRQGSGNGARLAARTRVDERAAVDRARPSRRAAPGVDTRKESPCVPS